VPHGDAGIRDRYIQILIEIEERGAPMKSHNRFAYPDSKMPQLRIER
jgi:hypothetical protein